MARHGLSQHRHLRGCLMRWLHQPTAPMVRLVPPASRRYFHFDAELSSPTRKAGPQTNLTVAKVQELVERFRRDLENPDYTLITSKHASRRYQVTEKDLQKHLTSPASVRSKENPYDAESTREFQQYWLPDVVKLAKSMYGEDYLVQRYTSYLVSGQSEEDSLRKVFGWSQLRKEQERPSEPSKPSMGKLFSHLALLRGSIGSQPPGLNAVKQSLYTNLGIWSTKMGVWWLTGSVAMLADAMHSMADVLNALLRYYGIHRAESQADAHHPYGHERRRFVFTDRSASIVLVFGCIFPLWHGISELSVEHALLFPAATIAVFFVSAFLESLQVRKAYGELKHQATEKQMTVYQYYRTGSEMMSISTFTEACIGMVGSTVGVIGVCAAWATGAVIYDSITGMAIASLVGAASLFLLHKNEDQLVGCTLPIDVVVHLTQLLLEDDVVTSVHDIKTEVYGTRAVRYKAEIHFNAEAITRRYTGLGVVPSPQCEALVHEVAMLVAADSTQAQLQLEDWVMRNNARFLDHLGTELKRIERIIREHLQKIGYKTIHVDLEPW